MTTAHTSVNAIVAALLATAGTVAPVRFAAIQAKAADKSQNATIYNSLVALADAGATIANVQRAGAALRRDVTALLRVAAGFTAVKEKGSKESGAPDFSTASVYAKVVADYLAAQRDDAGALLAAFKHVSGTVTVAVSDAGIPLAVSTAKRVLKQYDALVDADQMAMVPALSPIKADAPASVEQLQSANAALADRVQQLLDVREPADAAISRAHAERDALQEQVNAMADTISALRKDVADSRDEVAGLIAAAAEHGLSVE